MREKTLKSHALDAAADSAQLFLNAAISALDVPAGVVHQRFALGAEPGQNQRRARAQVGGANRRAGQRRRALHDGDAASALRALGPAVLLVCLSAALRGYTQGLGDMVPTAAGQVAESTGKLTVGLGLCLYLLHRGAGAPLCAAGAIGGVTAGAGLGLLVTALLLPRS